MPRHWVHSGDPFGKKKSQLIFIPNGPHHAFIRCDSAQNLDSALLLFRDRGGCGALGDLSDLYCFLLLVAGCCLPALCCETQW